MSLIVLLFSFRKSTQKRRELSFLLTKTILDEKGLCDSLTAPASNISLIC